MCKETQQRYTVLIVDDEEDFSEVIALFLHHHGFDTITASNGEKALEIVLNERVDTVITDVRMPHGDGVYLINKIKEHKKSLPFFVLVTGHTELAVNQAYEMGVEAVFYKPFELESLLYLLEGLLFRQGAHRTTIRVSSNFELEYRVSGTPKWTKAIAENVGRNGAFVATHCEIPPENTKIFFRLTYSRYSKSLVEGHGLRRWIRTESDQSGSRGFGMEFIVFDSRPASFFELINELKIKMHREDAEKEPHPPLEKAE